MPALPLFALHASHAGIWLCEPGGAVRAVSKGEAVTAAADTPLLLLNAPLVASRIGYPDLSGLDLLELFAFIHPARFMVPTPRGLAHALGLAEVRSDDAVPALLQQAAEHLLATAADESWPERDGAWSAMQSLARLRWSWAQVVAPRLARPHSAERWLFSRLPEWHEVPERPAPAQVELAGAAIDTQLSRLVGKGAVQREGQQAYAREAAHIFASRPSRGAPHVLLAQAGTGIGKTLGYLAPASLWAERAQGTVWVSTYTKNLQRQLRRESARVWPAARPDGSRPVVVRKGRENYLCLLNLEDALQGSFRGRAAVLAHLVARWAAYTQDGDIIGGDLPGWLGTLFRSRAIRSLTDQRGECIYAGCPHYRKCFIEHATRASAQADLVIANHALVMVNAARASSRPGRERRPTRIIFDEGHHVFDAADSTFSAALTGQEAIELRRWLLGPERGSRGRRRGLAARLADLASHDEPGAAAIAAACAGAEALPADGWLQRLAEGAPSGPLEDLLAAIRSLTYARDEGGGQELGYGIETEVAQLDGPFIELAQRAAEALAAIRQPLMQLSARLDTLTEDGPDWLDSQGRARVEGARHALGWRIEMLAAWEAMLGRLGGCSSDALADPQFVDWFAVERSDAREFDLGLYRHYLDPMLPFARTVLEPAHGVMLTSATLCHARADGDGWETAIARSGAQHLAARPVLTEVPSPFDYAHRAEVLIVTDIRKGDLAGLAGAYARIIEQCGGGVLGLFTAVRRLRAVHARIADRLARSGLPLHAQHVDPIDTGTLVDIFRDDERASLLGTDALRDGVDVPGHSLRCVVMEQVPWPKPSILHRARRATNGGSAHDDAIIRARLAQAFGRLIRTGSDRGHFIVLSAAFPSRLLNAFPDGTPVLRLPLADALHRLAHGVSSNATQSLVLAEPEGILRA